MACCAIACRRYQRRDGGGRYATHGREGDSSWLRCGSKKAAVRPFDSAAASRLIREVLFKCDPAQTPIPARVLKQVRKRAVKAIRNHLGDSIDKFNEWFVGQRSSFIKQIAQQKKAPGGELSQEIVRAAIMELGWRIHSEVAKYVEIFANEFADALPRRLTTEERRTFDSLFRRKPCFGNLPLIMLWARSNFLKQPILELWESPRSRTGLGVLYRLLEYYSLMAPARRSADKIRKGKKSKIAKSGRKPSIDSGSLFAAVAEQLAETRRLKCGCNSSRWTSTIAKETKNFITLDVCCDNCTARPAGRKKPAASHQIRLARDEFERFARSFARGR